MVYNLYFRIGSYWALLEEAQYIVHKILSLDPIQNQINKDKALNLFSRDSFQ